MKILFSFLALSCVCFVQSSSADLISQFEDIGHGTATVTWSNPSASYAAGKVSWSLSGSSQFTGDPRISGGSTCSFYLVYNDGYLSLVGSGILSYTSNDAQTFAGSKSVTAASSWHPVYGLIRISESYSQGAHEQYFAISNFPYSETFPPYPGQPPESVTHDFQTFTNGSDQELYLFVDGEWYLVPPGDTYQVPGTSGGEWFHPDSLYFNEAGVAVPFPGSGMPDPGTSHSVELPGDVELPGSVWDDAIIIPEESVGNEVVVIDGQNWIIQKDTGDVIGHVDPPETPGSPSTPSVYDPVVVPNVPGVVDPAAEEDVDYTKRIAEMLETGEEIPTLGEMAAEDYADKHSEDWKDPGSVDGSLSSKISTLGDGFANTVDGFIDSAASTVTGIGEGLVNGSSNSNWPTYEVMGFHIDTDPYAAFPSLVAMAAYCREIILWLSAVGFLYFVKGEIHIAANIVLTTPQNNALVAVENAAPGVVQVKHYTIVGTILAMIALSIAGLIIAINTHLGSLSGGSSFGNVSSIIGYSAGAAPGYLGLMWSFLNDFVPIGAIMQFGVAGLSFGFATIPVYTGLSLVVRSLNA